MAPSILCSNWTHVTYAHSLCSYLCEVYSLISTGPEYLIKLSLLHTICFVKQDGWLAGEVAMVVGWFGVGAVLIYYYMVIFVLTLVCALYYMFKGHIWPSEKYMFTGHIPGSIPK